ncbi:acyltransferase ChoActase/COT/CPT [Spinellus fusiger]|nr:acyltransferase ChoActase/COT/CPT [Spinellus fusiger]
MAYLQRSSRYLYSLGARTQHGLGRNYATKTFENQSKIPRLPIPELKGTATRYKRTLLPILSTEDYTSACSVIDDFIKPNGFAEELQKRLHALDKQEAQVGLSWLDGLWLNRAYLEYRAPVMLNVNWWCQFKDLGNVKENKEEGVTDVQLSRAAGMVSGLLDYSNQVNAETIPPETSRSGVFCMHQLRNVFGTSRIARPRADTIITSCPATAQHITVMYKDQIFEVPVFKNGQTVSIKSIEEQLRRVVELVEAVPVEQHQLPVGVLTSEQRDTWGELRQSLESNPTNKATLKAIDTSLFTLCLDHYSSPLDLDKSHLNLAHGRSARNRWFDKSLQYIIENNGRAGVNGEHSPCDAVVPQRTSEYVIKKEPLHDHLPFTQLPEPTLLRWDISNGTKEKIQTAQKNADLLIQDYDSVLLHYDAYGSDFMKKAKISPDGWLQMAYQVAYYRLYGHPCPTYESSSTRKFLTGRTETVRSCSVESVAFTKAWEDKDAKMTHKLEMMERAIASQTEYMKAASNGQGVDRHLFGLRLQMTPEEANSELAAIFQHPSYWGSQYWKLSTSNTSPGDFLWGGFGAVVPDGYGINYAISSNTMKLNCAGCI